jgi:hypothetical protein
MRIVCRVYPFDEHTPRHPEQTQWAGYAKKTDVGVAFSGGGTRSACLTLGSLRALTHLGLIQRARYLSAASGGAWCAVPWTFLKRSADEAAWLGRALDPSALTPSLIDTPEHNSFAFRATDAPLGQLYAQYAGYGDERFGRAIGHVFLRPDGLDHPRQLFTLDASHARRLAPSNPGVTFRRVERPERPFLVVGGAMILDDGRSDFDYVPFDMTPLYVGVGRTHVRRSDRRRFGGGFVDACGFDSTHRRGTGPVRVCDIGDYRFTLNDVMGTTGAAPAAILAVSGTPAWLHGMPRFHAWSIAGKDGQPNDNSAEVRFGDGGLYEHNGILSLLMRGVRKIVSFVNTRDPVDRCIDVARLFGEMLPLDPLNPARLGMQVFPRSEYASLISELRADGVALREHELQSCAHAGFRPAPGERATVLWVFNPELSVVKRTGFWRSLPADTRALIDKGPRQRPELAPFPQIPTFFPRPDRLGPDGIVELTYAQARLLSAWADWRVASPESEGGLIEPLCALFGTSVEEALRSLAAARG